MMSNLLVSFAAGRALVAGLLAFAMVVPAMADTAPAAPLQADAPLPGDTPAAAVPISKPKRPVAASSRAGGKSGKAATSKSRKGSKVTATKAGSKKVVSAKAKGGTGKTKSAAPLKKRKK